MVSLVVFYSVYFSQNCEKPASFTVRNVILRNPEKVQNSLFFRNVRNVSKSGAFSTHFLTFLTFSTPNPYPNLEARAKVTKTGKTTKNSDFQ